MLHVQETMQNTGRYVELKRHESVIHACGWGTCRLTLKSGMCSLQIPVWAVPVFAPTITTILAITRVYMVMLPISCRYVGVYYMNKSECIYNNFTCHTYVYAVCVKERLQSFLFLYVVANLLHRRLAVITWFTTIDMYSTLASGNVFFRSFKHYCSVSFLSAISETRQLLQHRCQIMTRSLSSSCT